MKVFNSIRVDSAEELIKLGAGTYIEYTGEVLVMRDAAQKRLFELKLAGVELPVSLDGTVVFYAGPTFVNGKMVIGPTTARRMDKYLEFLYELGAVATVGKGKRSDQAIETIKRYGRPYLVAPSGCAAFLSTRILGWRLLAFEDLGPEAVYTIKVKEFPLIVHTDASGNCVRGSGGADGT